ncbi:MAG: N-acetylglucosamine-6-phosphate deacetylase [Pyrinomonadaceae bacterium]
MATIEVKNATVVLSDRSVTKAAIKIDEGLIASIDENRAPEPVDETIEAEGLKVFAGFVDVHIHGAVGVDVNAADTDGLVEIARFLASNGVTAWVPTLVPDSDENYARVIDAIDRLMEIQDGMPIAQAVGVHYEGVFANEKMCGALRPEYFKSGQWAVSSGQLPRLKTGIHMMTLAPEVDGGIELIRELRRQSWFVSIGHTRANVETLDAAFAVGARHMTHFYNAMSGLHHRDVGVVGWALTKDDVTFDIIADGIHVNPRMLEFACRSKSPDKVSLISDSVSPTGLGDGEYEIWGEKVSVVNGRTKNERGSIAGSVISMQDAVKRMLSLGFSAVEVAKMASLNPARLLGIDKNYGSIEVGKRADLVGMDKDGNVKLVIVGGEVVFDGLVNG